MSATALTLTLTFLLAAPAPLRFNSVAGHRSTVTPLSAVKPEFITLWSLALAYNSIAVLLVAANVKPATAVPVQPSHAV